MRSLLPYGMADFERRGFRTDRPAARAILEERARSFLDGFNLAAFRWSDVHEALATVPAENRGFAYEGAAMYAAYRDLPNPRRDSALHRLLDGPGRGYPHLIHVGAGWGLTPVRLPAPLRLPGTPLLRWLALDGAGFGEVFFGGLRALARRSRRASTAKGAIRLAGCGRALWFAESADVTGVAEIIGRRPEAARPELWSGIGLASAYAGATTEAGLEALLAAAGPSAPAFAQGVVFGVTARVRSGIVPAHTELACRVVLGADPDTAVSWADRTAADLEHSFDAAAYQEWRARLRGITAARQAA
ncbi:DUF1702 family protein [Streptosporangium amethystogenes]|uniref:DUF1702 family protein n=1 Tax=Streptosporangium amethystogenes TaxID=2002 RepID=UPI00379CD4AC